jgi:hypothetical protein
MFNLFLYLFNPYKCKNCLVFSKHFLTIYKELLLCGDSKVKKNMNMKKTIIIMIVGAVVIGMGLSASAEEERIPQKINEDLALDGEELLISPNPDSEEILVIAPSPTEEDEIVIQILENQESDELLDTAGSDAKSSEEIKTAGLDVGIQAVIIAGTVFVLLTALLVLRRKK